MEFEKRFIRDLIVGECFDDGFTIDEIKNSISKDYEDLVDLRSRLANGTDRETTIYGDDYLTLDHMADYMEILMKYLKMGDFR